MKRRKVEMLVTLETNDGYGGRTEEVSVSGTFYGILERMVVTTSPEKTGTQQTEDHWLLTGKDVRPVGDVLLRIDGTVYRVKDALQQGRRFLYTIRGV